MNKNQLFVRCCGSNVIGKLKIISYFSIWEIDFQYLHLLFISMMTNREGDFDDDDNIHEMSTYRSNKSCFRMPYDGSLARD